MHNSFKMNFDDDIMNSAVNGGVSIIESGLDFITRLIDRRPVDKLDPKLFFKKLGNSDIIEVTETFPQALRALLRKIITKCILPLSCNGLDMDVLLINTENQFKVSDLYDAVHCEVCDCIGPTNVKNLVEKILNNLKIVHCYHYQQFFLTLNTLDIILLKNKRIGFIIIDSISNHYWEQKDQLSYDSFLLKMLNVIEKTSNQFKVVTLYSKEKDFVSKKQSTNWYEIKKKLSYEIFLTKSEISNELICEVTSRPDVQKLKYKIEKTGMEWVD